MDTLSRTAAAATECNYCPGGGGGGGGYPGVNDRPRLDMSVKLTQAENAYVTEMYFSHFAFDSCANTSCARKRMLGVHLYQLLILNSTIRKHDYAIRLRISIVVKMTIFRCSQNIDCGYTLAPPH